MGEDEVVLQPLLEGEEICPACRLAKWAALVECPNCAFWGDPGMDRLAHEIRTRRE